MISGRSESGATKRKCWLILAAFACANAVSCGGGGGDGSQSPPTSSQSPLPSTTVVPEFTEVTQSSGIAFSVGYGPFAGSTSGVSEFAGGVAACDYDGDLDWFVRSG